MANRVQGVTKRGPGRYRARYRAPDGRERSRTFKKESEARRWRTAQRRSTDVGGWVDPTLGRISFERFAEDYWVPSLHHLRTRSRELNVGVLHNHLLPRFGAWPVAKITPSDVKGYLADDLAEGRYSISAVRRHVMVLSLVLDAAVADGRIGRNPVKGIKLPADRPRPMRFLTPDEVAGLADAIGLHYRPLVLTAAYVGPRFGELAGLRLDRVDLLRNTIRVDQQLIEDAKGAQLFAEPKTAAAVRSVMVPATLVEILGEHFAIAPVQLSRLAFPTVTGRPMRATNFHKVWRRAVSAAGFDDGPLDRLTFHELRHTAAALAIAQGAHPLAIKERLGHSSVSVTLDRYGHLFPSLDESLATGLDGVLSASLAACARPNRTDPVRFPRSEVV